MNLVVAQRLPRIPDCFHRTYAHSSAPHLGANAIVAAAQAVLILQDMMEELKREAPKNSPLILLIPRSVATIDGGVAKYRSRRCRLRWDLRNLPDVNAEDIVAEFNRRCTDVILPQFRRTMPPRR